MSVPVITKDSHIFFHNAQTKEVAIYIPNLPYELVMLNEKEFCQITGQTLSTVRTNRIKGKGCNFYKIGGLVRYKLSDVVAYLDSCKRFSTTVV